MSDIVTFSRGLLLDHVAIDKILTRLAHEIDDRHDNKENLILVGVRTRGVAIAQRLRTKCKELFDADVSTAEISIDAYRDDRSDDDDNAAVGADALVWLQEESTIANRDVVVVDDVMYTGRTLRAALDALTDCGRPARVEALVLVDRGHRELPLRATYVGKNVPTSQEQRIVVRVREIDGMDGVWMVQQ